MEVMGLLGWTPEVFWDASFPEITAALRGFAKRFPGAKSPPMKKAYALKLFEEYDNG